MRSVYIHIPFCSQICSYCDFPKMLLNNRYIDEYLKNLKKEIKHSYLKDVIQTIYIGGGTPTALNEQSFEKMLKLTKVFSKSSNLEFTIEANPEDINDAKASLMKKYGVNRVSLGVQTFNANLLRVLGRKHTYESVLGAVEILRSYQINNINIDLIYALPNQTIEDLKRDLDLAMTIKPTHIAAYSLLIEPHTKLYIDETSRIDDDLDSAMYNFVRIYLKGMGYQHYEISNFAKKGYLSKHNLTYWLNNEYYGFGLGASGYLNKARTDNTKNLNAYLSGHYRAQVHHLTNREIMSYDMILGLRLIDGICKARFMERHGVEIADVYDTSDLIDTGDYLKIPLEKIYISNEILTKFL